MRRRCLLAIATVAALLVSGLALASAAPGDLTLVCPAVQNPVAGQTITCTYVAEPTPTTTQPPVTTTAPTTTQVTTTTVPPTTTTTVPPVTTTTPPVLGGYPSASNTGVPAGLTLQTVSGDLVASADNQVIEGKYVTGSIRVTGKNVVIRNSRVDGTVTNWDSPTSSFRIEYSTVGKPVTQQSQCVYGVSIGGHDFTALRVHTEGVDDAYRATKPGHILIRDSYALLCGQQGSHSDGIQACCDQTGPGSYDNISMVHNTIDQRRNIDFTAPVNFYDAALTNVTVKDNLFAGGTYSIFVRWTSGPKWTVTGNSVVDKSWAYDPMSAEGTCQNITATNNRTVTIDANYNVTGTVRTFGCID